MKFLFDNFDILAESPEGIKKLKEMILQFAVQGKLTEDWRKENPDVEPASVLLGKIKAEKERLVKEGKIKKQKSFKPITEAEIPFELPRGWKWCRLDDLGETQTGTTPPKKDSGNFGCYIPFIGPGDISKSVIRYKNNGLSEKGLGKGRLIKANSIMMVCIGGSIGKCAINTIDVTCNQQLNTITPYIEQSYKAIYYSLSLKYFMGKLIELSGGSATPIINKQKWSSIPIPLPPLAEQKRIVTKVNSLLALCDRLGESLSAKEKMSGKMLNAVVSGL